MDDRNWLLNWQAIRHAKECIAIVKDELNIKLKLSHPQFIQLLHEYTEATDSEILRASFEKLIAYADYDLDLGKSKPVTAENVVSMPLKSSINKLKAATDEGSLADKPDGKKMYRGQPV